MPERYNFVTDNVDDRQKALALLPELMEFCGNVHLHEFTRIGGGESYFITGQSIEVDSNAGCLELRLCLQGEGIAAVFINHITEYGVILKEHIC